MSPDPNSLPTPTGDAIAEELGFGEALSEIEAILARIEEDEIDIDELAAALSRAASLLDVCRGKIHRAEKEVAQVSQRLVPEDENLGC